MFNSLMIEGFIIYAVLYGLIGYLGTRGAITTKHKVVIWIGVFVVTFPGFLITLFFWTSLISAFSDHP